MGLLEEIQRMRQAGMQDGEIIVRLQDEGNNYRAISEAMSQSKIKQAVEGPEEPLPPMPQEVPQPSEPQYSQGQEVQYPQQDQTMQQSVMPPPSQDQQEAQPQEYFQGYAQQPQEYQQQSYDPTAASLSSDTIMEISEQVVSEKLSDVRKKLEKMSSFKTELETKTEAIEERLKRIEVIIDALQASVLRKVGDYVTNVEDIKKEMVETQKTFAKVIGNKHHHPEHKK